MTAPVASAAAIRDRALSLISSHHTADGRGPDPYDAEPRVHPMAEAKFLMTVAVLRSAGRLETRATAEMVDGALSRLEETANRYDGAMTAWGLGFPFRDAGPDEPYVITTAMILRALVEIAEVCTDDLATRLTALASSTFRWLEAPDRFIEVGGVQAPVFAPTIPVVARNVVAYWAGAMSLAAPMTGRAVPGAPAAAEWVLDHAIEDIGWTYSEESTRVDLLHTAYTLEGLVAALPGKLAQLDDLGSAALLQFTDGSWWADGYDVLDRDAARRGDRPGSATARLRLQGPYALTGFAKPARPWSIGEALVLASHLADRPTCGAIWRPRLRGMAAAALEVDEAHGGPRHAMHLAHGLAATLDTLGRARA